MQRRYITQKGSVYIQVIEGRSEYWRKENSDGRIHPLAAGIPIARKKLQELITEYPSSLLDRTYCFDAEVEREFFEDARREQHRGPLTDEPVVVFFLLKREGDQYGIGCSSPVITVEEIP